jgi:hypothetical protein
MTIPPSDLTLLSPPRISLALFARVLSSNGSPAAPLASQLYHIPPQFGLDPALALAYFHHESSYGTQGAAVATRNWGNLRRGQGRATGMLHGFASYRSWNDSLYDWCLLLKTLYIGAHRLTTVRTMLHLYAPSSDGNTPIRYADAVIADVARWQAEDSGGLGTHYKVKALVTSSVVIRAAPRKNGAVLGTLHAGDSFFGEPIDDGQLVTVEGFGSTSVWIVDAAGRCVWSGLLEKVSE